jgi:hypothetical protein
MEISKQFNRWLAVQFQKDLARDPPMQKGIRSKEYYGALPEKVLEDQVADYILYKKKTTD